VKRIECDVLVVGGGVAGVLAAASAARDNARAILVEKESYLGGTGYAGMLQHICGLYLNGNTAPLDTLHEGMVREVVGLLLKHSPEKSMQKIGKVFVLPYKREGLCKVLETLCNDEKNLSMLLETAVISVMMDGPDIRTVVLECAGSRTSLEPAVVIDCSGNGALADMAGAQYEMTSADNRQLAGYVMHVKGLQNSDETLSLKVPYVLAQAVSKGALPFSAKFTTFSPGDEPDEGFCKMSVEGEDSAEREMRAKQDAAAIHDVLRNALPAFKDSRIVGSSLRVTDREGRRILGDYMLTRADVLQARKFTDGVVRNAWPIELWDRTKGTVYEYVPAGDYYEIPFRCMKVKGLTNLLTAGRCISVSHEALGSTRVMGTCMALGEQAGKAAAYRVKEGSWPDFAK